MKVSQTAARIYQKMRDKVELLMNSVAKKRLPRVRRGLSVLTDSN